MPESDPAVRYPALDFIKQNKQSGNILDLGVGSGFYGRALHEIYPNIDIYGIEIWKNYIGLNQTAHYKHIYIDNILSFDYNKIKDKNIELVIAGDVMEHLFKSDALNLFALLKTYFKWIVVTIPITVVEQGPDNIYGNVHETHLHQWTVNEMVNEAGFNLIKDCGICGLFSWRV
jgi:trans-aconitate methyltransferase